MKKFTFGTPETLVPSRFCKDFRYSETPVSYPAANFTARQTNRGFLLEFPLEDDAQIYGFGLQLKQFCHRFWGKQTWGNFLKKVSLAPFKNFLSGIKWISFVQFRCFK